MSILHIAPSINFFIIKVAPQAKFYGSTPTWAQSHRPQAWPKLHFCEGQAIRVPICHFVSTKVAPLADICTMRGFHTQQNFHFHSRRNPVFLSLHKKSNSLYQEKFLHFFFFFNFLYEKYVAPNNITINRKKD